MTPAEAMAVIRGAQWRTRKQWELVARVVAYIVSALGAKHFTPARFLEGGPEEVEFDYIEFEAPKPLGDEERKAFIDRLAYQHKMKFWTKLKDKYAVPPREDN